MLKRVLSIASLVVLVCSCGGGDGSGAEVTSAPERIAGVYLLEGETISVVYVDGSGNFVAAAGKAAPGTGGFFSFGGRIERGSDGSWLLPTTVYSDRYDASLPGPVIASTPATVHGAFSGASLSFVTPAFLTGFPNAIGAALTEQGLQPATLSGAVGRYVSRARRSVDGPLTVISDITVDASAHIRGLVAEQCSLEGTIAVMDPNAPIYTVTGALAGAGCPDGSSGSRTILGVIGAEGTTRYLSLYMVLDNGRLFTPFAGVRE